MAAFKQTPEAERFWAKVNLLTPSGCWEWASPPSSSGYCSFTATPGQQGIDGKTLLVHRWSYEFLVGPIAPGLQLDHLCRNKVCVNPSHLEPVTAAENFARMLDARDLCKRGHEYIGRTCKVCRAQAQQRFRARKKEKV